MLRALALCLILSACAVERAPVSPDTGLSGSVTRQVVISDHPHHVLLGHVLIATDGAETTRALVIQQRRDGVHRVRMWQAWQDGRALPFRRLPSRAGCTHGTCRDNAVGFIALGPMMLEHAARNGFSATLIGREGAIPIQAPAALFAEALAPP